MEPPWSTRGNTQSGQKWGKPAKRRHPGRQEPVDPSGPSSSTQVFRKPNQNRKLSKVKGSVAKKGATRKEKTKVVPQSFRFRSSLIRQPPDHSQ